MKYILFTLLLTTIASADFQQTSLRYQNGHEIRSKILSLFPTAFHKEKDLGACAISDQTQAATGLIDAVTGHSIYSEPTSAFAKWYQACLQSSSLQEFTNTGDHPLNLALHVGPGLEDYNKWVVTNPTRPVQILPTTYFSDQILNSIIEYHMDRILGPDEVVVQYGYITNPVEFRNKLLSTLKNSNGFFLEFLRNLEMNLMLRDEFISY